MNFTNKVICQISVMWKKSTLEKNKLNVEDGNRIYKTKGGKIFPYKIAPEVYSIFEIPLMEM